MPLGLWPRLALLGCGALLSACPQLQADDFRLRGHLDRDASVIETDDAGPVDAGVSAPDATAPDAAPDLSALSAALTHRYSFEGFGASPPDTLGGAPAYIYNGLLDGQGYVRLIGNEQYVSLPNGVLSSSADKTIEAWLTWRGGAAWQRIFDFGVSSAGEFNQGSGLSYLYLTTSADDGVMTVAYSQNGLASEVRLTGTGPFPRGLSTHVAVVIDSARDTLGLYLDGELVSETTLTERLGSIDDVNVWIGRSQYADDPGLDADVAEFRIYDAALSPASLALSFAQGPDAPL